MRHERRNAWVLTITTVAAAFAACGASPEPPMAEPVPQRVDCEKAGGLCLPNTNAAPPRYRQANFEEGVCQRRDDICWLRQ
ncbi:MAG: hypothetical protein HOV80_23290 [Polyangiaceae bacterium]|nr:hypothetical protein [Polyangiaceae bacterium]